MGLRNLPQVFLRLGLAFTLLYAAWSAFQNPLNWIGFLPSVIISLIPFQVKPQELLMAFSVVQVGLAALLLWGKQLVFASLAASAFLLGIIWFNLGAMDIVFRDVGLFFAALALALLARKGR
ncbi:MAG: hypothetical protein HY458_00700 [Parcubacteria group bacterium]|nr:hypothetical protein [Parcubacteria group bacterium]